MFSVESIIREDGLPDAMKTMRAWLDHEHAEPMTFRYTFTKGGIVCRVDFQNKEEAVGFAKAFDGTIIASAAAT